MSKNWIVQSHDMLVISIATLLSFQDATGTIVRRWLSMQTNAGNKLKFLTKSKQC